MKFSPHANIPAEFLPAYEKEEREQAIRNTWRGCAIGAVFVPLFYLVDLWKYPEHAGTFLNVRLLCAGLMVAFLPVIRSTLGRQHFRFLGLAILLMPSSAIAWMIYMTGEGATSPYYAGLILVLMFLGAILEWTFLQSVASVVLVWALFAIACLCSPWPAKPSPEYLGLVVNNVAFLVSTGVVIIVGTYFNGIIRTNEFVQRCEREKERLAREEERKQSLANLISLLGEASANLDDYIKNRLVLISLFFDLLDEQPELRSLFDADVLQKIRSEIDEIRNYLNDLKIISTNAAETPLTIPLKLNETVGAVLERQQSKFAKRQVVADCRFDPDLPLMLAHESQITKLFEQLLGYELANLPDGSIIRIATQTDMLKGRAAVRITLIDNGSARPVEVLQHLSDPRTKPPKPSADGLKLVLISLIVQKHGGTIEASSPADGGNQFIIRLPLQPDSDQTMQSSS